MILSNLIKKLKNLEDSYGDVLVTCCDHYGDEEPVDDTVFSKKEDGTVYKIHLRPY